LFYCCGCRDNGDSGGTVLSPLDYEIVDINDPSQDPSTSTVPEPLTIALIGVGAAALFWRRHG
jgi:hypothetical protein